MSLRDTIEGARDEAKVTVDAMAKKSKDEKSEDEKAVPAYDPFKSGKSSAAGARPTREAAASVRMEGERTKKNPATMTKEEKKAARAEERRLEDKRNTAYDYMLRNDPDYAKTNKTWWILLGVGFAMTIVSLLFTYVFSNGMGVIATVALILAYAFIIAAFVYDFRKRRKCRKSAEKRLQGMNDKRVAEYVHAENEKLKKQQIAEEEAKAAKKAAKGK